MSHLSLKLLGSTDIVYDGQPLLKQRATKVMALLIFLANHANQRHDRERLMDLLWPGLPQKSAQTSLRQTLFRLRQLVPHCPTRDGATTAPFLLADRHSVQVNPAIGFQLDVASFTALLERKNQPDKHALAQAADLYRGDFLDDFYLPDSNVFEDWAAANRERLQGQYMNALEQLGEMALAEHDHEAGEGYARQLLEMDGLRESAHRQLMRSLANAGRRRAALSHYETCRQLLRDELGIEPSTETQRLAEAIRAEELEPESALVAVTPAREEESTPPIYHNLPSQPTPFVGRERELAALSELVGRSDGRLVTITGPGGMGKTRLALAWAERFLLPVGDEDAMAGGAGAQRAAPRYESFLPDSMPAHPYPDGIFFINLAPLDEVEQMVPALAAALRLPLQAAAVDKRNPKQQLLDYLRHQRLLLLLDNFEHLSPGSDLVKDILQAAPGVQILVTSRERLHLRPEQVFPIQGLDFPDWERPAEALQHAAARLFSQAARRIQPDFEFDNSDSLAQLARICRLVAGMPLAIELAAGWVDVLSLAEIADEIQQNLDFLETELRDVPQRHRSVRAAINHSWQRLTAEDQRIFAQLSVFRGGFSREAAEAVAGASLRQLARLVNKSFLHFDRGREQYQVHELMRQYGGEKLAAREKEQRTARDRHAAYYCALLRRREIAVIERWQLQQLAEIEMSLENILIAWNWGAVTGQYDLLHQGIFRLCSFFELVNKEEGARIMEATVDSLNRAVPDRDQEAQHAFIMVELRARLAVLHDDWELARSLFLEALSLLPHSALTGQEITRESALLLMELGAIACNVMGQFVEARTHWEESLSLFRDIGESWWIAGALNALGELEIRLGQNQRAKPLVKESLSRYQALGSFGGQVMSLGLLSNIALFQGDRQAAVQIAHDGLIVYAKARQKWPQALSFELWPNSNKFFLAGVFDEMLVAWQEIHHMMARLGLPWEAVESSMGLAMAHMSAGNYESGRLLAERGLTAFRQMGLVGRVPWPQQLLGMADLAQRKYASARQHLHQSAAGWDWKDAGVMAFLALAELALGNRGEAKRLLSMALRMAVEQRLYIQLMESLPGTALLLASDGEQELAAEVYAMAFHQPFIGNSRLWRDIAGRQLEEVAESLPSEVAAAAKARGEERDLWQTAAWLLEEVTRRDWTAQ